MAIKKSRLIILILISSIFVLICLMFPYKAYINLFLSPYITSEDLSNLYSHNNFIFSYKADTTHASDGNDIDQYALKLKLFNLFTITNLKVNVLNDKVIPGGNAIGISLNSKGVVLIGSNFVITKNGTQNPVSTSTLKVGDIIIKIGDTYINNADDINAALVNCDGSPIQVEYKRGGQVLTTSITPALDYQTKTYKLGLWIRDNTLGVGTLTYIKDDLRFGSLGHAINDADTKECFEVIDGQVYDCDIISVKKGQVGSPGELVGLFMLGNNIQGVIDTNCNQGVYGYLNPDARFLDNKNKISVGGRLTAKVGKAQILSTIDKDNVETYDIEIIKLYNHNSAEGKNMVIKITDPRLLDKTGGIVQGMSGSPIIQDGKIIGAVTHVFVNDPTKGFGLYLDNMIDK